MAPILFAFNNTVVNNDWGIYCDDAELSPIRSYYIYSSLKKPVHVYAFNYTSTYGIVDPEVRPNPFIKHSEYGYTGTGQIKYEKVWKAKRSLATGAFTVVPEKHTSYEYDALDHLIQQVNWIDPNNPDWPYSVVRYGNDVMGNRTYVVDPKGNIVFTDFDNAGRRVREYFAEAPIYLTGTTDIDFAATYSNATIKSEIKYFLDGKTKQVLSFDYDGTLLACSEYLYDTRGRICEVRQMIEDVNNDNQMDISSDQVAITIYEYSDLGTLQRVSGDSGYHIVTQDAEGKRTGIKLSYNGKPLIIKYPSLDYEEYVYYEYDLLDSFGDEIPESRFNGLLEKKAVWRAGVTDPDYVTFTYDEFGQLSRTNYPDGYLQYQYTYRTLGKAGKVEVIEDFRNTNDCPGSPGSCYSFRYDAASQNLVSYTDQDDYTINYDYNAAHNRVSKIEVLNPSSSTIYAVGYSYDLAGRLTDVNDIAADPNIAVAKLHYDENGNRAGLSYSLDGTPFRDTTAAYNVVYDYTVDNQLESLSRTGVNCDVTNAMYGFSATNAGDIDGLGRLRAAEEQLSHPAIGTIAHSYTYDYDNLSQLTQWKIYDPQWILAHTYGYQYRKDGNIRLQTVDSQGIGYEYDKTPGGSVFDAI